MITRIEKDKLLAILHSNQKGHLELYEKAWAGFVKTCIDNLNKNLENIKNNKKQNIYVNEIMPVNHTDDYLRAIQMLNHSVDDIVSLSEEDYSRYVQDNWEWKKTWTTSNSKYM